jgi:hypothetical protein
VEIRAKRADAAAMCSVHLPARGDGLSSAFASHRAPHAALSRTSIIGSIGVFFSLFGA